MLCYHCLRCLIIRNQRPLKQHPSLILNDRSSDVINSPCPEVTGVPASPASSAASGSTTRTSLYCPVEYAWQHKSGTQYSQRICGVSLVEGKNKQFEKLSLLSVSFLSHFKTQSSQIFQPVFITNCANSAGNIVHLGHIGQVIDY